MQKSPIILCDEFYNASNRSGYHVSDYANLSHYPSDTSLYLWWVLEDGDNHALKTIVTAFKNTCVYRYDMMLNYAIQLPDVVQFLTMTVASIFILRTVQNCLLRHCPIVHFALVIMFCCVEWFVLTHYLNKYFL